MTTGNNAVSDCVCNSASALSSKVSSAYICFTVPTAKIVPGALSYTTADEISFTVTACDDTMGYKKTPASSTSYTSCTATGCGAC